MSNYRRNYIPGGTYFFTLVTERRRPLFAQEPHIAFLRTAICSVKQDQPFKINAAVVLPDHLHFIWSLPPGDDEYPKRIGRIKAKFTKLLRESGNAIASRDSTRVSKQTHRERDIWQRRFWEHTIDDVDEFAALVDYIHYNPVKHGLARCPHAWESSSFHHWVKQGFCESTWGCRCAGKYFDETRISRVDDLAGDGAW